MIQYKWLWYCHSNWIQWRKTKHLEKKNLVKQFYVILFLLLQSDLFSIVMMWFLVITQGPDELNSFIKMGQLYWENQMIIPYSLEEINKLQHKNNF